MVYTGDRYKAFIERMHDSDDRHFQITIIDEYLSVQHVHTMMPDLDDPYKSHCIIKSYHESRGNKGKTQQVGRYTYKQAYQYFCEMASYPKETWEFYQSILNPVVNPEPLEIK